MLNADSVIFHTLQDETSHFPQRDPCRKKLGMTESEIFRRNLERLRKEQGYNAAQLSLDAGLNRRAVQDIEEGRAKSPKLDTVLKLAKTLKVDPGAMIGMEPWQEINPKLADFLSQYGQVEQERLLAALEGIAPAPSQ